MRITVTRPVWILGPAFIAAIAYVDPGNVATNVTAGSQYGYLLVWVVIVANFMAVLVQYLSAKLGLVSQRSLSTQLGNRLGKSARIGYWLQAELIAIATDLAEVIGGAVALQLLFDLPLLLGAALTAVVSIGVLMIGDLRGQKALERTILAFLTLIAVGFLAGMVVDPPNPGDVTGGLVPRFDDAESVLLASGIVGATVMPHVVYLHSSLTSQRLGSRGRGRSIQQLLIATRIDVVAALAVAGVLNLALLVVAAHSLTGLPGTDTLPGVHRIIESQLGVGVAILFAVALLGSGLASTSVGCAAGAEVMRGLLNRRIPMLVRRAVTVLPALIILALGVDASRALVLSQVMLSAGIPFALIPLIWLTSRRQVMGAYANHPVTIATAGVVAALVIALNVQLVVELALGG